MTDEMHVYRFSYYATGLSNMEKVRKALFMFVDLFGLERYNYEKLVNFMVTVKTNYRSGAGASKLPDQ